MLGGLEPGGVPLATMLSSVTGIPALFVRKDAKTYGTLRLAEGGDPAGRQVLLIEDVITTGGAVLNAAAAAGAAEFWKDRNRRAGPASLLGEGSAYGHRCVAPMCPVIVRFRDVNGRQNTTTCWLCVQANPDPDDHPWEGPPQGAEGIFASVRSRPRCCARGFLGPRGNGRAALGRSPAAQPR
jgi:hypothetical protein